MISKYYEMLKRYPKAAKKRRVRNKWRRRFKGDTLASLVLDYMYASITGRS